MGPSGATGSYCCELQWAHASALADLNGPNRGHRLGLTEA